MLDWLTTSLMPHLILAPILLPMLTGGLMLLMKEEHRRTKLVLNITSTTLGLVVAVALLAAGYRRRFAVLLGMASGLVEPVGAVIGAAAVSSSAVLLPWGLGFAAGAMLFVISHEIIPESHRKGHEAFATGGLMLGFVLMMVLDTALG